MTENMRDKGGKIAPEMKAGDRLWLWLEGEPSAFEDRLSKVLTDYSKQEQSETDNGVFHVRLYSWRGRDDFTQTFLKKYLPRKVQLPFPRMIAFLPIGDKEEFSIPDPTLSFSHEAEAGSVHISAKKYLLMHETVLMLASRQTDHDREGSSLAGTFDVLGLISLLSGQILHSGNLLSSYFCARRKKFLSGALGIVKAPSLDWAPVKFTDDNPFEFDARDDRTHGALWFSGRAFASSDDASKIVFYVTALELLTQKNIQNYLRSMYRRNKELQSFALTKAKLLADLRAAVVHNGRRVSFPIELQRYTQAMIIDAIRNNHNVAADEFAMQSAQKIETGMTRP